LKIAFWSNASEKCNVSANLAAVSIAGVLRYPYSVILIENRLSNNNLGKAFNGASHINLCNEVGTNYYDGSGMEGLLRKIYRGNNTSSTLQSHLKEIINQHLYYIPQSKTIHNEIFDYEFDRCFMSLLRMLEENADICMIDTASHNNLSTKTILEEADLIVVNLCQQKYILDDFFSNYSSIIPKAVFIISDYDYHFNLNTKRISCRYQIPLESIIAIPGNLAYQDAYLYGSVVEFIYRYYSCLKDNPNFAFIYSIKKAAYTIIKRAEFNVKQKELSMCCK
jgi:hypothetical protein